jgi:ParB family chromosome partitioning protein
VTELADQIAADEGVALATYREPLAGTWAVLASLPVARVRATPFQRELSKTHVDRLATVIPKVGRYLDPIVVVRQNDEYWTPNGMHRLEAMRKLGARSIIAIVVPDTEVAFRILALNTEKAHNLKDKSLEVMRMAKVLADEPSTAKRPESDWAFEFEEPAYITLGICYEQRPRYSGGAYLPVVKRCEEFATGAIGKSLAKREERATLLLELDDAVNDVVSKLKSAGFKSAYLKPFVVARINPLRWQKAAKPGQKAPRGVFESTIGKMLDSAREFDVKKVRPQDIAAMGAIAGASE